VTVFFPLEIVVVIRFVEALLVHGTKMVHEPASRMVGS
jgi:hypothetical protein